MNTISSVLSFMGEQYMKILEQSMVHLYLTLISLLLAAIVAIPTGIYISRHGRAASWALGITGILQTVPSIALLGFLIPFMGIGAKPAIFALFLYALLPILRNTYTGITQVSPSVREAAYGMGMSGWQVLWRVELPLALPVLFAGIRTAAVINVGVATLAAYIGAGGLGEFIFGGIALNNADMIVAGALPAALLALVLDQLLALLQKVKFGRRAAQAAVLLVAGMLAFTLFAAVKQKASLLAGFTPEFIGRNDGLPGLKKTYGLQMPNVIISSALGYRAVAEGNVDVIDGYSTDGRVKAYKLRILVDDAHAFPPYQAAPLVRQQTLDRYPGLQQALEMLAGRIDDATMTRLNYEVDQLKRLPEEVAAEFLKAEGLLNAQADKQEGIIRIGSKIFTEQYLLVEMYRMLIETHTGLQVETKAGLGGTKICFDALKAGEIDMYPEYTGTGYQVLLQPDARVQDSLANSAEMIYTYVKHTTGSRYGLSWLSPIGFNNTYALMMLDSKAEELGITTTGQLAHYLHRR